jgi:hypothetical protein
MPSVPLPALHCNGCRACCLNEHIQIMPEEGDDPALYETEHKGGKIYIRPIAGKKACRYLGPQGCTIYDKRPRLCRAFDCRVYMLNKLGSLPNRQARRNLLRTNPGLKAVFAAATSRLG